MGIVTMGASIGGMDAFRTILSGLPETFPVPICIVQHIGAHASRLAALLEPVTPLRVVTAEQGATLLPGHVYVAPPDRHVLVRDTHLDVLRGPRENFARPAIDPLFRSAAEAFGPAAIGVVLTGRLNDGTAGLYDLKRRGGIAVVQSPESAESPDMPRSALAHVEVDHCVALDAIAPLLQDLVARPRANAGPLPKDREMASREFHEPVALTCPDCGGAMRREECGTLVVFTCHTGHRFTAEALADGERTSAECAVESLVRRLNERVAFCHAMQQRAANPGESNRWSLAAAQSIERRDAVVRLFGDGWIE